MIYGIGILDSLKDGLGSIGYLIFLGSVFYTFLLFVFANEYNKKIKTKPVIISFIVSGMLIVSSIFIPTTKIAASMVIIPAITNNENLQNIGENALKGLEALTEDWLKELRPGDGEKDKGENP